MKIAPKQPRPTVAGVLPYLLIVGGAVGLVSSFVLTYDKMELLKNPHFTPNCNLDPVLSCGSVMHTAQSSAFGFPNPWIGLMGFAIFITVGVAILAGAQFKRWFWLGLGAGTLLGLVFAYWLLFESIYVIQALCPYCLATDVALITVAWYLTLHLLREGHLRAPKQADKVVTFMHAHHLDILVAWFLVIISIILQHFWYYYGQFI